jgi:hypothetical protein
MKPMQPPNVFDRDQLHRHIFAWLTQFGRLSRDPIALDEASAKPYPFDLDQESRPVFPIHLLSKRTDVST